MIKLKLKSVVLGTIVFVSSTSFARPVNDVIYYAPVFQGGNYTARVNFNGSASSISTSNMATQDAGITRFMNSLNDSYWSIRSKMISGLNGVISSNGATLENIGQWGDISIGIAGVAGDNGNSKLQIDVNGLNFDIGVRASKSEWYGSVTCFSRITLNNFAISSQYNPFSGEISATTATYTPNQSTSCDTSYSWIPFIGDFINRKADSIVGNIMLGIANSYTGKVIEINEPFFGFDKAITPNTYMVGGIDAGMYIKNNLANLYIGKRVNIFIANEYKYDAPSRSNIPNPATTFSGNRFSINFSDGSSNFGFNVEATKNYTWVKRIIPGTNNGSD